MPSKKFSSTRVTGLIVAGAVALIIAGVVLVVAVSQRGSSATPPAVATGDVTDIGSLARNTGEGASAFQDATNGRIQFEDRDNPSRLQAELIYRRTNPVGGGYYELDEPRAWIYLKDGRALFIRSDTGRVKMPNRTDSPEKGQFVGNVVALMFPARDAATSGRPRDPMTDQPAVVARTDAIRFDAQLLEFASDDQVTIETPAIRFSGSGVTVRGNQVLDRIEYLKVVRDGVIRYRAPARNATERTSNAAAGVDVAAVPADAGWEIVAAPDLSTLLASADTGDGATDAGMVSGETEVVAARNPDLHAESAPIAGNPAPKAPTESLSDQPPGLPAAAVAAARAQHAAPPQKEDLYEAVFANKVRVTQLRRELASDALFVWLRTLDNALPDDAFGSPVALARLPQRAAPVASAVRGQHGTLSAAATVPAVLLGSLQTSAQWPPSLFSDEEADIVLTWDGPLSVKPIAVSPPPRELANGNHLALRFSSKADGGDPFVRLSDAELGARGGCEELEYLATSRDMTLTSGPGAPSVWLAAPNAGCISGQKMRVNLASGVADMPGAGLLATLNADLEQTALLEGSEGMPAWLVDPRPEFFTRTIDWRERADFQFATRGGQICDALEWAEFRGDSFVTDNHATLAGQLIRAKFVELAAQTSVLSELAVEGGAEALVSGWRRPPGVEIDLASGGFGPGALRSETLKVRFEPSMSSEGEVDPAYVLASGNALVGKDDASLRAPMLEASIERDAAGELVVTDFEARGQEGQLARFDRGDGIWATGQRIKGHAQRQTASVTGPAVEIAHGESRIQTTIVELDGVASTMNVFAPGIFSHQQPTAALSGPAAGTVRVTATWRNSMTFDDTSGVLECRGESTVIKDEPLALDTVKAERIRVELSGRGGGSNAVAEVPTEGLQPVRLDTDLGDRRVIRATAYGTLDERSDGKPATVETRAYAAPARTGEQRSLETISYLESARIIADDQKGTIETPLPGRAIVFDQRSPDVSGQDEQAAGVGVVAGSPRGTSSFRWEKSMTFTRDTGLLDLVEKIEVVHKPLDARPLTRMTSDRLQAKLDLSGSRPAGDAVGGGGGRLVYAEAIGSVYAESGPQRLVGDRVMYDARLGTAVATALQDGSVTLFDDRRATPFTARRLKWDLLRDQIEILEPATVVAPR